MRSLRDPNSGHSLVLINGQWTSSSPSLLGPVNELTKSMREAWRPSMGDPEALIFEAVAEVLKTWERTEQLPEEPEGIVY